MSTELVIAIISFLLSSAAATILLLIRQLMKSHQKEHDTKVKSIWKELNDLSAERKACEAREITANNKVEIIIEKLREKFIEINNSQIETEARRGQRVDALFNVIDKMKQEIANFKPLMLEKLELLYNKGLIQLEKELKDYIDTSKRTGDK
jgi:hypothetical protein